MGIWVKLIVFLMDEHKTHDSFNRLVNESNDAINYYGDEQQPH